MPITGVRGASRESSPGRHRVDLVKVQPLTATASSANGMLGRRVATSAMWSALDAGLLRAATFAVTLVVARLVAPHDFGVFTVAITVYSIAMTLTRIGVTSALVREHDRSRELAPTAFTISLIGGGLIAAVMVIFAPFFARELGAQQATDAIRVLALIAAISGFSTVPFALLSRDFLQRRQFLADCAFFVVSTATMLVLVLAGHPVMGLAWGQVAGQVISTVLLMLMSPEKYWPGFQRGVARHLLVFGVPLAGSLLATMAITNVDFVVVGHLLGAKELGFYNLAFGISGWPFTVFTAVLISVTLPTLSRVRHSPTELSRHLNAGLSAIVALAFPVCALISALAAPLIDTVYGSRWHPAWLALVILMVFGAARAILQLFSDLVIALGLTRHLFAIQVVWFVALTVLMVVCVDRWGIAGAAVAHGVAVLFVVVPMYVMTLRRHTRVDLGMLGRTMLHPLVASLAGAGAAYGASCLVHGEAWKLLLGLACGLVVYAAFAAPSLRRTVRTLHTLYWRQGGEDTQRQRAKDRSAGPLVETPLSTAGRSS